MYFKMIAATLFAWLVGLVIDGNLGHGEALGFTAFRVLFPMLAIGLCILREIKKEKDR